MNLYVWRIVTNSKKKEYPKILFAGPKWKIRSSFPVVKIFFQSGNKRFRWRFHIVRDTDPWLRLKFKNYCIKLHFYKFLNLSDSCVVKMKLHPSFDFGCMLEILEIFSVWAKKQSTGSMHGNLRGLSESWAQYHSWVTHSGQTLLCRNVC